MPDVKKIAGSWSISTCTESMLQEPREHHIEGLTHRVRTYLVWDPWATMVNPESVFLEIVTVVNASDLPTLLARPSISIQSPSLAPDRKLT